MTNKKVFTAIACAALVLSIGGISAMAATGSFTEAKGGSVSYDGSIINDNQDVIVSDSLPEGVVEMIGQGMFT